MPLERCSLGKKQGWKFGSSGKCYLSKKDAIKQGIAELGPDKFKEEMQKSKATVVTEQELESAIAELIKDGPEEDTLFDQVSAYISQKTRNKMTKDDFGWPEEEKFPIRNQHDLDSAAKLIGRAPADKQDGIKSRIKRIAKRKGLALPESWK